VTVTDPHFQKPGPFTGRTFRLRSRIRCLTNFFGSLVDVIIRVLFEAAISLTWSTAARIALQSGGVVLACGLQSQSGAGRARTERKIALILARRDSWRRISACIILSRHPMSAAAWPKSNSTFLRPLKLLNVPYKTMNYLPQCYVC